MSCGRSFGHLNSTGQGQLYVYRLDDGSTRRVSTNPNADYRYPHGEAAPYSVDDRALLAEFSARLYDTEAIKRLKVE